MPDRARARVLVTALLLVLTVAGIRAIGPPGDWGRHASDAVAVGLLVEVALAGLFVVLRWRHAPQGTFATRLNKQLSGVLGLCMAVIAITILFAAYGNLPDSFARHHAARLPKVRARLRSHPFPSNGFNLALALRDVLIALVIIAIVAILVVAWLRRRSVARLGAGPELAVDEAESDLARAIEAGRAALHELDDARAAIIRCYVAMEQSLREAGAERGIAETPDELLARAVEAGLVPRAPAGQLTGLFYEARYSTHPMPASARDEAERSLAGIAAVLPVSEPT